MTLEQYLATKKPVSVTLASARKANEGADGAQWKNTIVLNKTEEDFIHLAKEQEAAAAKNSSKTKATKQFLAIEQRFSDQSSEKPFPSTRGGRGAPRGAPRGGRGGDRGRGGERGRGSRGGARGGARGQSSYDNEFPSL